MVTISMDDGLQSQLGISSIPDFASPSGEYDDAVIARIKAWRGWGSPPGPSARFLSRTPRVGSSGVSFVPFNWDTLYFHHAGIDTSPYKSVDLHVNGGPAGGQDIGVAVWDGSTLLGQVEIPQLLGHPLRPNTWEHVIVPLSAVAASGRPPRDLYIQDDSGGTQGTVYVDDVHLIP